MKRRDLVLLRLIVSLGLILPGRVTAQTFTILHNFTATSGPYGGNSDGTGPQAGLILSGNTLYGTAYGGGDSGKGTVFSANTDGTAFTNLHSFTLPTENSSGQFTNSDGSNPSASLVLSGNALYGTTLLGGSSGNGTVFKLNIDGTGFTNLHNFTTTPGYPGPYTNSDGANPSAGLILAGNTLYGTTGSGGGSGRGTIFTINTDGSGFTNLYSFTATSPYPSYINGDGASPYGGLILSGNKVYGTASSGGSSGKGTVFAINTDGTGFTNLHSFTAVYYNAGYYTNNDGANPRAALILSGDTLYGTASEGGQSSYGTVFKINTDGTGFTNLHSFTAVHYYNSYYTNSDGANPYAGLLLRSNTLYGTASEGGTSGRGTAFAINTDGTDFMNLHTFIASEGATPRGVLILSGDTLYGTAPFATSSGSGAVFSLSFAPPLTITPSGSNGILSWPSNFAGFNYTGYALQAAPAITGTFTNLPGATSPYTNPITGAQQFFRLISN